MRLALVLALVVCFQACRPHASQDPFDSTRWKSAKLYGLDETRLHMIDDVQKRTRGMSRADVEALLGPESDPAYFRGWNLRYWLGPNGIDG